MTIQTELRTVTDRIQSARHYLARCENAVLAARHNLTVAESDLDIERRALMARSDAGTNDIARRAYAERETAADRERADELAAELLDTECLLIQFKVSLATLADERRYLETIAKLAMAHLDNLGVIDDSDYDDDQREEDESGYNADVAAAVAAYAR